MTTFRSERPDTRKPRRRWGRWIAYIAIALVTALFARVMAVRSFDSGPMPPALAVAGKIPVTLPDGRQVPLSKLVKPGLPTVVTMWASWCGPCRLEAPEILKLRQRFGSDKLNLVYLNVRDDSASRDDLAQYMISVGFPPDAYAVLHSQDLGKFTNSEKNPIPRAYVFDRAGKPEAMIVGYNPLALGRVDGLLGA